MASLGLRVMGQAGQDLWKGLLGEACGSTSSTWPHATQGMALRCSLAGSAGGLSEPALLCSLSLALSSVLGPAAVS